MNLELNSTYRIFNTCPKCGKNKFKNWKTCRACSGKQWSRKKPYYADDSQHFCQSPNCETRLVQHLKSEMKEVKHEVYGCDLLVCLQCYNMMQKRIL